MRSVVRDCCTILLEPPNRSSASLDAYCSIPGIFHRRTRILVDVPIATDSIPISEKIAPALPSTHSLDINNFLPIAVLSFCFLNYHAAAIDHLAVQFVFRTSLQSAMPMSSGTLLKGHIRCLPVRPVPSQD